MIEMVKNLQGEAKKMELRKNLLMDTIAEF